MARSMHRRRFLQTTAAAAGASFFVNPGFSQEPKTGPNEKLRVAIIGINGQGEWNLNGVNGTRLADIVALCDVDTTRSANVLKRFPQARFYEDYRRMIDQHKELDAVLVATPDHHHAPATMLAMRAGKHVYCEKPLAHSVHEIRTMMDMAARQKVVTQMGTQIHAGENYHRVVEIVKGGVIGPVRRVHVWNSGRPVAGTRIKEAQQPPNGFNWDLWLGPAPEQHYPPFRTGASTSPHFHWRWWWDFGGGVLADLACHYMDLPHWALDLRRPTSVAATGRVTHQGDNQMPDVMQVDWEYPARGDLPPVHLTWYHGVSGPGLDGKVTYPGYGSGILFEGEKGQLVADYGKYRLLPEDRFRDVQLPAASLRRSPGHHREWLEAIRSGRQTSCNFEYSGSLAETVLLGNVAYRADAGKLQYDPATGRIANGARAEQYLRREYRRGWTL